jgi:hypothetical protein
MFARTWTVTVTGREVSVVAREAAEKIAAQRIHAAPVVGRRRVAGSPIRIAA